MPSFAELLQQGTSAAWLFIPTAVALGALHGLEPGHSKTMMAAFIVAIRGTVLQAVLLGLAATVSHTAVVWAIALGGMYLWQGIAPEAFEPWLQLLSGAIIVGLALWMLWRVREDARRVMLAADQAHGRGHHHAQDDVQVIDTGHGAIKVEVSEDGVPPRWRVQTLSGHRWQAEDVTIAIERPSGATELFTFRDAGAYLESRDAIAEPHEFTARVRLSHGDHAHDYDLSFVESDVVPHGHALTASSVTQFTGHQNAHELAHAHDIRRRFTNRNVTTGQIVVFGLTGGLIPCPAAITVLLLCLQLKEVTLGAVLVLSFSVGLALTLVAVGVAAALSVRHVGPRLPWLSMLVQRAPYVSGVLILIVGVYIGLHGFYSLQGH